MVVYEISIDHETLERMGVEIAFALGEAESLIDARAECLDQLKLIEKQIALLALAVLDLGSDLNRS